VDSGQWADENAGGHWGARESLGRSLCHQDSLNRTGLVNCIQEARVGQCVEQRPVHLVTELSRPIGAGLAAHQSIEGPVQFLLFGGKLEIHGLTLWQVEHLPGDQIELHLQAAGSDRGGSAGGELPFGWTPQT